MVDDLLGSDAANPGGGGRGGITVGMTIYLQRWDNGIIWFDRRAANFLTGEIVF